MCKNVLLLSTICFLASLLAKSCSFNNLHRKGFRACEKQSRERNRKLFLRENTPLYTLSAVVGIVVLQVQGMIVYFFYGFKKRRASFVDRACSRGRKCCETKRRLRDTTTGWWLEADDSYALFRSARDLLTRSIIHFRNCDTSPSGINVWLKARRWNRFREYASASVKTVCFIPQMSRSFHKSSDRMNLLQVCEILCEIYRKKYKKEFKENVKSISYYKNWKKIKKK